MLSTFLVRWRNQRFKPSKRFVISTCALAIIVIVSTILFIFNNLSVATHQLSFRNGSTPYATTTVGKGTTATPNIITNALGTPVVVATGTRVTNPGASGGKGGNGGNGGSGGSGGKGGSGSGGSTSTPPPTTSTVTPVVAGTSVPPTSVPPTPTPIVTHNRAQISTVSASSSFEASGWSITHINDDITASTPGSMGWSSDGDFVINHTEWITFDFGSFYQLVRLPFCVVILAMSDKAFQLILLFSYRSMTRPGERSSANRTTHSPVQAKIRCFSFRHNKPGIS